MHTVSGITVSVIQMFKAASSKDEQMMDEGTEKKKRGAHTNAPEWEMGRT